jgi:hypothetical protein
VAHAGHRAKGEFAHSLNATDLHTTWVETRTVLGRAESRAQTALDEIRQALPFRLRGIDSDTGSEFINPHPFRDGEAQEIRFTRERPDKKDDNAHIEQKHWPPGRQRGGSWRYATPATAAALNALSRHELRLFHTLFLPPVKLLGKERVAARVRRRDDAPRTPLERVQGCPEAGPQAVAALVRLRAQSGSLRPGPGHRPEGCPAGGPGDARPGRGRAHADRGQLPAHRPGAPGTAARRQELHLRQLHLRQPPTPAPGSASEGYRLDGATIHPSVSFSDGLTGCATDPPERPPGVSEERAFARPSSRAGAAGGSARGALRASRLARSRRFSSSASAEDAACSHPRQRFADGRA